VRTLRRLGSAASDLPLQTQEILDDLRKGSLEIRTTDPSIPIAVDVLGRRAYSGLVVGSLITGSAILLSQESWIVGTIFLVGAASWGSLHTTWALWLGRKRRRK
jgi:ubiquinone biosynthesis protein